LKLRNALKSVGFEAYYSDRGLRNDYYNYD